MNKTFLYLNILLITFFSVPSFAGSCAKIKRACLNAGFISGAWAKGIGLWAHCINPLVQGVRQPAGAKLGLPVVDTSDLEACRNRRPQHTQAPEFSADGSKMTVKKAVTHSADSSIRYYKFIKTAPLPAGTSYLSKLSGKVRLQQYGVYTLSLNSLMVADKCPNENHGPFLEYNKQFYDFLGPVRHNLAQFILRGTSAANLNYSFPSPIPVSGCLVFIFDGGPLSGTSTFTMSADVTLEFDQSESAKHARSPVLLSTGHEFFPFGDKTAMAYLQPIRFKSELKSIYGNYSNLGTNHSVTEFYVAKGGCGTFPKTKARILKYEGSRASLLSYLPADSQLVHTIDKKTPSGRIGLIQETVSQELESSVNLEAGDCLVSISYAPAGAKLSYANFENQMKYFLLPR
jgi:hypothetical protein